MSFFQQFPAEPTPGLRIIHARAKMPDRPRGEVILWYVFVAYFLAGEVEQLLKAEIDDDGFELV